MVTSSILLEIQDTVEAYAGIMSKVAQIEVEVVDENLYRIAGTGIYAAHVNEDMSAEGYVYRHVLQTGNMEIIYEPGREELSEAEHLPGRNRDLHADPTGRKEHWGHRTDRQQPGAEGTDSR